MSLYGQTRNCSHCHEEGVVGEDLGEQYDRYYIYAGLWHETCWDEHGYKDFVFDEGYAGESLEEVD